MLTADQLDALTDDIVRMYNDFADTIIADIARRLAGLDYARPTAAWQMQRLIEAGKLFENILSEISKLTGRSEAELRRMFERAGVTATRFDDAIYKAAGLNPMPLNMSPAQAQALSAGLVKTAGVMRNLTMTTAMSGQQAFIDAADLAYMQISTGALDYNTAIRRAVKDVASKGLSVIQFSGRRDQLDVAMRRAALTGVNQTVGTMQNMRADEMGSDLVQVSAHIGARPTHEVWQGKIYSRSGSSRKYPDFVSSTGYGTGEGLMGWNCRHSFYPYFDGISENAYSRAELASYANKTVVYNGKKMSVYEATQEQRAIERKIRYWKRQAGALKAAGLDASAETAKVKAWQAQARDLVRQTGLSRQYAREQVFLVDLPKAAASPVVQKNTFDFVEAKNIEEANAYAKDVLGLDFADYKGVDIQIANDWNKGLSESFNKMPELRKTINATGSTQGRYSEEVRLKYDEIIKTKQSLFQSLGYTIEEQEKYAMRTARRFATKTPPGAYAYSITGGRYNLDGVFVSGKHKVAELMRLLESDITAGFHPLGTGTIRSNLIHEVGHQISDMLNIFTNDQFLSMYRNLSLEDVKSGLSIYAASNKREFVAEAWSEYICSDNPRPIAKSVGDLIMKIYQGWKK